MFRRMGIESRRTTVERKGIRDGTVVVDAVAQPETEDRFI
jgi:hypothetical protein